MMLNECACLIGIPCCRQDLPAFTWDQRHPIWSSDCFCLIAFLYYREGFCMCVRGMVLRKLILKDAHFREKLGVPKALPCSFPMSLWPTVFPLFHIDVLLDSNIGSLRKVHWICLLASRFFWSPCYDISFSLVKPFWEMMRVPRGQSSVFFGGLVTLASVFLGFVEMMDRPRHLTLFLLRMGWGIRLFPEHLKWQDFCDSGNLFGNSLLFIQYIERKCSS